MKNTDWYITYWKIRRPLNHTRNRIALSKIFDWIKNILSGILVGLLAYGLVVLSFCF